MSSSKTTGSPACICRFALSLQASASSASWPRISFSTASTTACRRSGFAPGSARIFPAWRLFSPPMVSAPPKVSADMMIVGTITPLTSSHCAPSPTPNLSRTSACAADWPNSVATSVPMTLMASLAISIGLRRPLVAARTMPCLSGRGIIRNRPKVTRSAIASPPASMPPVITPARTASSCANSSASSPSRPRRLASFSCSGRTAS